MSQAYTSHRIVKHGNDRMVLSDCGTGQGVVEAVREGDNWRIQAAGAEDRLIPCGDKRDPAISAMNQMAFELTPSKWITIKEPHQIVDDDGNTLHIRDEQ